MTSHDLDLRAWASHLAIEDSGTGATSANAAGCQVLVVPHFVNVPDAPRRTHIPTLEHMTPAALEALFD